MIPGNAWEMGDLIPLTTHISPVTPICSSMWHIHVHHIYGRFQHERECEAGTAERVNMMCNRTAEG